MRPALTHGLALALADGEWTPAALRKRVRLALGEKPSWLSPLVRRVMRAFPARPNDVARLTAWLRQDDKLHTVTRPPYPPLRIRKWFAPVDQMAEVSGPLADVGVPALCTTADVAAWLDVTPTELGWFADLRQLNLRQADQPRLRHYAYRWVEKRSGGWRLLETPKRRIKTLQRRILHELLDRVPVSAHAHGFVARRSVHSFVAPHVGKRVVVRLDLEDFFAAVARARVRAIFARLGYPPVVARLLTALCTSATPEDVLGQHPRTAAQLAERFATISRLRAAHLPQGAPTSPALSNLAALALDRRLAGLAASRGAHYTRYADDLLFSGGAELSRDVTWLIHVAGAIALDEGFAVNFRKTRVMRSGRRQQIAGLVLNERVNVRRADYDELRATLHNAGRFGPASQNRAGHADFRAHLEGRIAWVAASNPGRGEKLRRLFEAIEW